MIDDERERSIFLDERSSVSIQRPLLISNQSDSQEIPSLDEVETQINLLYLYGDRLFSLMANLHTHQWQKMKLQYALIMALREEIKMHKKYTLTT